MHHKRKETTMKAKNLILAGIAGAALLAAAGARAGDDWRHGHRGHYDKHHGHYHGHGRVIVRPARVYYPPRPVYYAPARVYYPPAPVYYAPPAPVLFGTVPVGDARVSFGVRF
jgi:hypothetical protein